MKAGEEGKIACASDVLAAVVVLRCNTVGLSIPNDISLIGFDYMDLLATLSTQFTAVHVPAEEMCVIAARAIVDCLDNGTEIEAVELHTQLVKRQGIATLASSSA